MKRFAQARKSLGGMKTQAGVMIIEALVAILIFSLGIVALMGMQATSIAQTSQAKYRTDASYLATQILGKMWVDQGPNGTNLASYQSSSYAGRQDWDAQVAATLPQGAATIVVAGTLVTVTITWKQPEDVVTHKYSTFANLNLS